MTQPRADIIRVPILGWDKVGHPNKDWDNVEVLEENIPRSVAWWRLYHQYLFSHAYNIGYSIYVRTIL